MIEELKLHIHGDSITSEVAAILNIAYEIQELNSTMKKVCEAVQLIAIKLKDNNQNPIF